MNYIFCWGGGGGGWAGDQKNKYVWRYDEIMIYFLYVWKMFLGSLKFEYVLGMPDIPYILGVKSRCWVQCQA